MATERALLSLLTTKLQLENRPFPSFNKPLQRDTSNSNRCQSATIRMMGSGKCNVIVSQFRGINVFCSCLRGIFKYNGTLLEDTC